MDTRPDAVAIDAFSMNWKGIIGYYFPPFDLVGKLLAKKVDQFRPPAEGIADFLSAFWKMAAV